MPDVPVEVALVDAVVVDAVATTSWRHPWGTGGCVIDSTRSCNGCSADGPTACPYPYVMGWDLPASADPKSKMRE